MSEEYEFDEYEEGEGESKQYLLEIIEELRKLLMPVGIEPAGEARKRMTMIAFYLGQLQVFIDIPHLNYTMSELTDEEQDMMVLVKEQAERRVLTRF